MELNMIYNIDALEGLKQLEDDSIDLILTSPPYNKAGLNGVQVDARHKSKNGHKTIDYGGDVTVDCKNEDEYQKWQLDILKECYRVLKDDGSLFYNHKNRIVKGTGQISSPYQWLSKSDFLVRQEIVWNRGNGKDCNPYRYYSTSERVYWLTKSSKTKLKITKDSLFSKEIWDIHADARTPHPAPFPLELPYAVLSNISDIKGLTVLDPFMGSGTTAVMATMFDCNYIGFELFPEYIDIANQRVAIAKELKALGITAKDVIQSEQLTKVQDKECECAKKSQLSLRQNLDYYPTPKSLVWELLKVEQIDKSARILEPCCGQVMSISNVLKENGYKHVTSKDIIFSNDFLKDDYTDEHYDVIITNPPFTYFDDFLEKAKKVADKVYFIMPLEYTAAQSRLDKGLWNGLKSIYTFSRKVDYNSPYRQDGMFKSGRMTTGWYCFEKGYQGSAFYDVIDVDMYVLRKNQIPKEQLPLAA